MPRTIPPLALILLACSTHVARADEPKPAAMVFTASDVPGLARGFRVPDSASYTVKVWDTASGPTRIHWSLKSSENKITLTPGEPTSVGKTARPKWEAVGKARLLADSPATLVVEVESGHSTLAVPALLAISADPGFDPSRAADILRGRIDTTGPPADPRRLESRTNARGVDFEPPASPQEWRDRARASRERLLVNLGLWPMFPKTELHPRITETLDRDGYAIEKIVLETLPGFYLAGNLYRPTGKPGRLPLVLCPHGHWPEGRVNPDVQARCVRLAQLGCVVFLYDMVGYADGKPFGHAFLNDRLRRWGLSLPTLQTWNSLRALDYLTTRPDVDPARVGMTGESGGGTQTFLLAAIDERVKVVAPVVMVSDGFQGGCVCENAAGLRIESDNVEFAALAAPRPMKLVGASGDWTARTMTNALPSLQVVYAQSGAADRLEAEVFPFPHNYNQTSRNAVYAFFARWLIGIDDLASTREGPIKLEAPADLFAFGPTSPYPSDAKSPAQLEAELVGVMARQLDRLAPGEVASTWEAARDRLMTSLKVRVGIEDPAPRQAVARSVREVQRDGLSIAHFVVGRRSTGELIPVVRLTPGHPNGRLTVLFNDRGKADLVAADGSPTPLVKALLDRGQSVVGFDPLLIGESADPSAPAAHRPAVPYFDTYNPSLAADRAQDLATVLSWARSLADVRAVNLVATGESGALALLARPALIGLSRTAIDLGGIDFGDGSGPVPHGIDLPGVLQFGGLKAASALVAPAPLRIHRLGAAFAAAWPVKAYALADAPAQLRIEAEAIDPDGLARWLESGD